MRSRNIPIEKNPREREIDALARATRDVIWFKFTREMGKWDETTREPASFYLDHLYVGQRTVLVQFAAQRNCRSVYIYMIPNKMAIHIQRVVPVCKSNAGFFLVRIFGQSAFLFDPDRFTIR